ncbi:MAG: hypothetical protein IJW40_02380 [Clostridia bacterium]|nr:hypothetical protein [Clostridia bacterium]
MEKKASTVTYVIQLVIILIFFAILCFPLTLMALDGPDETEVESEAATELVPLSTETYFDGTFHSAFEAWFSHHYPLRSSIVSTFRDTLYNFEMSKPAIAVMNILTGVGNTYAPNTPDEGISDDPEQQIDPDTGTVIDPMAIYTDPDNIYSEINLKQMAEIPVEPKGFKGSDRVYIGKSGYLFESGYIDEYYGYTSFYQGMTEEGIAETVARLEYIQEELAVRYDITMLYILSSSKASQYADFIPDHYKNRYIAAPDYVRPVDMMRPLLAESSLNYLDSSEYYKEIGLLVTFPKTGIHWNHIASFESTAELLRMYADISGNDVKLLDAVGVISSTTPISYGNSDVDVYNILYGALGNVEGKIMDDAYYEPDVAVDNEDASKINVFIQGGSFTADIVHYLTQYQVANVRRIYYNGDRNIDHWGNSSPWTKGIMVWEDILEDLDMIIFEQTEAQVRDGHVTDGDWLAGSTDGSIGSNAVYDSLYEFLKATE